MYNKILIPATTASIILNCVLGYNLYLAKCDLRNAENTSQHYYNELVKEKQYSEMDKIAGLSSEEPETKKPVKRLPNIFIPPRSKETYSPIQSSWPSMQQPAAEETARNSYPQNNYAEEQLERNLYKIEHTVEDIKLDRNLNNLLRDTRPSSTYWEY